MEPPIEAMQFGTITLAGIVYHHDVLLCPDTTIRRRKKKHSKAVYGTSHTISLAEAKYAGARWLIIGAGQCGRVALSPRAGRLFCTHACDVFSRAPRPRSGCGRSPISLSDGKSAVSAGALFAAISGGRVATSLPQ